MEAAISNLHAEVFSNYNIWAQFIGGRPLLGISASSAAADVEKLQDLCLWYLVKTEAANLRFMPEYVIAVLVLHAVECGVCVPDSTGTGDHLHQPAESPSEHSLLAPSSRFTTADHTRP